MISLLQLFAFPFIAAVFVYLIPSKRLAALLSLLPLLLLIFEKSALIGQKVQFDWFPPLGVQFYLSVDYLSYIFLLLTAITITISLLVAHHSRLFLALILALEGLLFGFFTARDLVIFTIFWEAMLIPLYLIIAFWGTRDPLNTTLKFIVYMIAGSCLLIAALLLLYQGAGHTFDLDTLTSTASSHPYATAVFLIFALAFAVKTPLFPFHAWLPDAYCFSPLAGTILLSAILSKAGIYGFLRIGSGLFPQQMQQWGWLFVPLAVAGVIYGALAAWTEKDFKRLIAYSSLSHVNFILVGVFVWNDIAHAGSILQSFNHGITIAALFLVAAWLQERVETTSIDSASGLAAHYPKLCWLTLFFVLSSVALPGLNNFIGELLILFGLFGKNPWLTAIVGSQVILSVMYMLRWMQKMYFQASRGETFLKKDIGLKEIGLALPLIVLTLWIGFYPSPLIKDSVNASSPTFEVKK